LTIIEYPIPYNSHKIPNANPLFFFSFEESGLSIVFERHSNFKDMFVSLAKETLL